MYVEIHTGVYTELFGESHAYGLCNYPIQDTVICLTRKEHNWDVIRDQSLYSMYTTVKEEKE